jgi:hypothetical protein|tara:strand:+ start:1448 stop:1717 length:270 start_codon:yes stop_codon:yes gene_type:complete
MNLRKILRVQQALLDENDRAFPADMHEEELKNIMYYSESAEKEICILDMDIVHFVRTFIKIKENRIDESQSKVMKKLKQFVHKLDLGLA